MVDPISAGLGVASLVGGFLAQDKTDERLERQAEFNSAQAAINREFSREQAQKQMDFQERMSNSAYQRATADMRAAGINPLLAYSKGGASQPGGAMGTSSPASMATQAATDFVTPAVSSALQGFRIRQEVENMVQNNLNLKATEEQTKASTANVNADTAIKFQLFDKLRKEAEVGQQDEKFYQSKTGEWFRWLGNIGRELNPFGVRGPSIHLKPIGGH